MPGLILLIAFMAGAPQTPTPTQAATATLTGKVVDRSGGVLPGVTVTLEPPGSPQGIRVVSDGTGSFQFKDVAPGTYSLKFELAGFATYSATRVAIAAGQTRTLNVGLELGPMVVDRIQGASAPAEAMYPLADGEVGVGVETSLGTFYIAVDTNRAPITAANFLKYVDGKVYDGGRFHRATRPDNYEAKPPNRPMMNIIQGGIDPAKRSQGFPAIPLERTSVTGIKHVVGVVSMARGTPDSATSDFFVLLDDQPSLDCGGLRFDDGQGGAAFGHVLAGLDVVRRIQQQPVDGQNLSGPVAIKRVWRLAGK